MLILCDVLCDHIEHTLKYFLVHTLYHVSYNYNLDHSFQPNTYHSIFPSIKNGENGNNTPDPNMDNTDPI